MAQQHEEIIIIQDEDAAGSTLSVEDEILSEAEEKEEKEERKKKTILLAGGAAAAVLLLILILVLLLNRSSSHTDAAQAVQFIETKLQEKPKPVIEQSQLEKIIAKANYLYTTGNKQEALNLYEQIALYSEAISSMVPDRKKKLWISTTRFHSITNPSPITTSVSPS